MADRWERVKEPVSLLLKHGVDKMIPNIQSTNDSVAVAAKIVQLLVDKPMKDKSDPSESEETPPEKKNLTARHRLQNQAKTNVTVKTMPLGLMTESVSRMKTIKLKVVMASLRATANLKTTNRRAMVVMAMGRLEPVIYQSHLKKI
jgi:hypothetical protein